VNTVCLIGNIVRDLELRYLASGMAVVDASIAVNDRVKKGADWVDEPSFFDMTLFGRTAEVAAEYAGKGTKVAITGKLKQDSWIDKDSGMKRSKVKIVVDRLDLIGAPGERKRDEPADVPETDEIPF
jgi:single-strand DNA-binding protein